MTFDLRTIKNIDEAAEFLAGCILEQLKEGRKVLLLVPGGSAMPAAVQASKIIFTHPHENLTVTLTDERYGEVGHKDSNLFQLQEKGFDLPQAKIIPILSSKARTETVESWQTVLQEELAKADFKIGLFGIGADAHTAGILPRSPAVFEKNPVSLYNAGKFERITITFSAIKKLDEAVVFAKGGEKEEVIKNFTKDLDPEEYPSQILKQVPKLTIFYLSR